VEYGSLAIASQRARRDLLDLITNTPADGLIGGIGHVNGATFPDCCVALRGGQPTTTPCWPGRKAIRAIARKTGSSSCAGGCVCLWCCFARAAGPVRRHRPCGGVRA